jgi:hypothetical protein
MYPVDASFMRASPSLAVNTPACSETRLASPRCLYLESFSTYDVKFTQRGERSDPCSGATHGHLTVSA